MKTKIAKMISKSIYKNELVAGDPLILQKYLDEVRSGFRELEDKKILEWRKLGKVRNDENENSSIREYYRKGRYYITENEDKLVDLKIDAEYDLKKEITENFLALDFTEKEVAEILAFAKRIRDLK